MSEFMGIQTDSIPSLIKSGKSQAVITAVGVTGLGSFIFDIKGNETTTLNSRVTQYPIIGDTGVVSDNIVNDTFEISLEGSFGSHSLNDTLSIFNAPTQFLGNKLKSLGSLGHLSNKQKSGLNKLLQTTDNVTNQLSKVVSTSQSLATLISTSTNDTRAGKVFALLQTLRDSKILFDVDTNAGRISNCSITSLSLETDNQSGIEYIRLTLKQLNLVKVKDFDLLRKGEPQTILQNAKDQISTQFSKIKSNFF